MRLHNRSKFNIALGVEAEGFGVAAHALPGRWLSESLASCPRPALPWPSECV